MRRTPPRARLAALFTAGLAAGVTASLTAGVTAGLTAGLGGGVTGAAAAPAEDHWTADPADASPKAEARALIAAGRFAEAQPILAALAKTQPGDADVFNLLGFAYRKTGDLGRSAPAYARALRLDPHHRGALEYQGELFLAEGRLAAAEANLRRLTQVCAGPCEEAADLAAAIADWRAAKGG